MNKNNTLLLEKHKDILSFRDLAVKTVATYTSYLTTYIQWIEVNLPGRDLSSISWEELRAYLRFLKEIKKLNPRTINVHISQLRDFYFYVLHKDWDRREIPMMRFDEHLPIVPSKDQINAIINSIDNPKHKAEIALLYSSGIRVSELCRLHCGDIRMQKHAIYISRSKNRSDRFAVLSDRALNDLITYVKTSYHGATQDDWLFPGRKKDHPIHSESVRLVFFDALARAGLSESGFNLHSLRHAFGLHLYESGVDLMSIKEAMGHKVLSSTTVYLTLGIGNGRSVKSPYDTE
jgi:site-specific recombinase XerD